MSNPFKAGNYEGVQTYYTTVTDMIRCVRTFTREQCRAALALPGLQKGVAEAVRVRLRKLNKESAA